MRRKTLGLGMIVALIVAGIWAAGAIRGPGAETTARQRAVSMLGTGGSASQGALEQPPAGGVSDAPVSVNLADVPAGVYDPNNQFDRWQRGEGDLENEALRAAGDIAALQEASLRLAEGANIQRAEAGPLAPVLGTNFDSLDINDCCGGGANVPPDPEMAAGPNHVIAIVNVAFEIYNKSGAVLAGPITLASFLSVQPNCIAGPYGAFDPNVLYDEKNDRYLIGADGNGRYYCLAVSQTNDPLGSYWVYAFPTGTPSLFFDYPHAGVGEDAIYVGANMFTSIFLDSRIWALDKADMYVGAPASYLMQNLGANEDTPQPVNLHGWAQGTWPGDLNHYILTETGFNGANHTLWRWDGPFNGANTFASVAGVNLNAATGTVAGFPVNVTQSGGGAITANDWRPLDFEFRNGYGWTTMTIGCNPGGGTVNCVRWAQIDLSTGAIGPAGAGVFSSAGNHRFFPDLAVNQCNDMAVGYTKSSGSIFPAVWVNGRESGDPPGALQAETQLKVGEIAYTAFDPAPRRWGDYTGMTIDPDGLTFWYLGEYSKITGNANGRWGTYIGSFTYPDCGGGTDTVISRKIKSVYNHPNFPGLYLAKVQAVDPATMTPVAGATVDVTLTLPDGTTFPSALTNAGGWAKYQQASAGGGNCTITVDNITAPGYTFDPFQGVTTQTIPCPAAVFQPEWTETP